MGEMLRKRTEKNITRTFEEESLTVTHHTHIQSEFKEKYTKRKGYIHFKYAHRRFYFTQR